MERQTLFVGTVKEEDGCREKTSDQSQGNEGSITCQSRSWQSTLQKHQNSDYSAVSKIDDSSKFEKYITST